MRYGQEESMLLSAKTSNAPMRLTSSALASPPQPGAAAYRRDSDALDVDELMTSATNTTTATHSDDEARFIASLGGFRSVHSAPTSPMPPHTSGAIGDAPRDSPANTQTSSSVHSGTAANEAAVWSAKRKAPPPPLHSVNQQIQQTYASALSVPPGFSARPTKQPWMAPSNVAASKPWPHPQASGVSMAASHAPPAPHNNEDEASALQSLMATNPTLAKYVLYCLQQQQQAQARKTQVAERTAAGDSTHAPLSV